MQLFNCNFNLSISGDLIEKYPEVEICGCLFHVLQSLLINIKRFECKNYTSELKEIYVINMFFNLAFVPNDLISEHYMHIYVIRNKDLCDLFKEFKRYFFMYMLRFIVWV